MSYTNTAPIAKSVQSTSHVARGLLTLSANAGDTETVTIGSKTYTFQATLTNVDGNVKIGANAAATIANLVAAINLDPGAGTTFATAMTIHPTATASINASNTSAMDAVAKNGGAVGLLATTETLASGAWGAVTFTFAAPTAISLSSQAFTNTAPNAISQSALAYGNTAPIAISLSSQAFGNTAPVTKTPSGYPTALTARVATTGNVDISGFSATEDGVDLVTGNIVLVKSQTAPAQNGVYTVVVTDGIAVPTRHTSADSLEDFLLGLLVTVTAGTVNTHKRFALTNARYITDNSLTLLGDFPPNFAEFVPVAITIT